MSRPKNAVCLWFDGTAEEAATFYAATFPQTEVTRIIRTPGEDPGSESGKVLVVEFTCLGIPAIGLNGGPQYRHSEAFSFQVITEHQEETDRYWDAIVGHGGEESQCGWCKDKWGISWQITPRQLMDIYDDPDPAATQRAFQAMLTMKKIDIATIEAARAGA